MVIREITCPTCKAKIEVKSKFAHLELSKHNSKEHKPKRAKKAIA
jgi:hypothetical protein